MRRTQNCLKVMTTGSLRQCFLRSTLPFSIDCELFQQISLRFILVSFFLPSSVRQRHASLQHHFASADSAHGRWWRPDPLQHVHHMVRLGSEQLATSSGPGQKQKQKMALQMCMGFVILLIFPTDKHCNILLRELHKICIVCDIEECEIVVGPFFD